MTFDDKYKRPDALSFYVLAGLLGLIALIGFGASHYMETHGHVVTGMNNQVVWGLPHVFAVFMIVAASGVLNVASIGSVFGKPVYKARAPLSGLLAIALLAGGLFVLMLDLGRPDRLIVAMTNFNFKSIFAMNVILYTGFFGIVGIYLWTMLDKKMKCYSKYAGFAAFIWRLALTTATGSIFGFLVARQGFDSALLAPMFVIMSFSYGLAFFILVQSFMYKWNEMVLDEAILRRLKNLLATFVGAVLYMTIVYHITNLYFAKQWDFERFILVDGGHLTTIFWFGQIALGSILPIALLLHPTLGKQIKTVVLSSALIVLGAFSQLYVLIIGGQTYPLDIFPGMQTSSSFFDGAIHWYSPSMPEFLLGLGGLGVALLLTTIAVRVLQFVPKDEPAHTQAD